jgi:hypothetical protein
MLSPVSNVQSGKPMGFAEAIQAIIDRKKITKLEWDNPTFYGQLRDGYLMIHLADGWHRWLVSDGDLMGVDWVILRDQ